jgi:DNA-binding transcriptional ArsR family regulator
MAYDLLRWAPPGGDWSFLRRMGEEHTEAAGELLAAGLSPIERFVLTWAHAGGIGESFGSFERRLDLGEGGKLIPASEVAEQFGIWADRNVTERRERDGLDVSPSTVGTWLKRMLPETEVTATAKRNLRRFPSQPEMVAMLRRHQNRGYAAFLRVLDEAA